MARKLLSTKSISKIVNFNFIFNRELENFSENFKPIINSIIRNDWGKFNSLITKFNGDKGDLIFNIKKLINSNQLNKNSLMNLIINIANSDKFNNENMLTLISEIKRCGINYFFTDKISINTLLNSNIKFHIKPILIAINLKSSNHPDGLVRVDKRGYGLENSYLVEFINGSVGKVLMMPVQNVNKSGYIKDDIKGAGVYGKVVVAYDENQLPYAVKIQKNKYYSERDIDYWKKDIKRENEFLRVLDQSPITHSLLFIDRKPINQMTWMNKRNTGYIIEKYNDGQTLESLLKRNTNIGHIDCTEIILKLAKEIKKYHDKNIAHLDIKPDNIIVNFSNGEYHVALIDPGVAIQFSNNDEIIKSRYEGKHCFHPDDFTEKLSLSTDIYSLGRIAESLNHTPDLFIMDMLIENEIYNSSNNLLRPNIDNCIYHFKKVLDSKINPTSFKIYAY